MCKEWITLKITQELCSNSKKLISNIFTMRGVSPVRFRFRGTVRYSICGWRARSTLSVGCRNVWKLLLGNHLLEKERSLTFCPGFYCRGKRLLRRLLSLRIFWRRKRRTFAAMALFGLFSVFFYVMISKIWS